MIFYDWSTYFDNMKEHEKDKDFKGVNSEIKDGETEIDNLPDFLSNFSNKAPEFRLG